MGGILVILLVGTFLLMGLLDLTAASQGTAVQVEPARLQRRSDTFLQRSRPGLYAATTGTGRY